MQPEGVALDLILESNKYTMYSTDLHNTIQYNIKHLEATVQSHKHVLQSI